MTLRVCAPAGTALRLSSSTPAGAYVEVDAARWEQRDDGRTLHWRGAGHCGSLRVDLMRLARSGRRGVGLMVGPDVLVWPEALLWWPADRAAGIDLQLDLPSGWSASLPWPRNADGHYHLGDTPRDWPGLIAIGTLRLQRLRAGSGEIELGVLGGLPDEEQTRMHDWIAHSAGLLRSLGGLPVPRVQVLVVPLPGDGGPVPWGQNTRAGMGGVHFFVHPRQSMQSFVDDWTAAHEFCHLLHPYLGADRWMSEGLASYYQNLLRARAGDISSDQAWANLLAGFERGRRDTASGLTLADLASDMRRHHAYMRVYWAGAAYWLQTDVELRRLTQGRQTLDQALRDYAACCLPSHRRWTADEFAARLDQLTGHNVFAPAAQAAAAATAFPSMDAWYAQLGLALDAKRSYAGRREADWSAIRDAILPPVEARGAGLQH